MELKKNKEINKKIIEQYNRKIFPFLLSYESKRKKIVQEIIVVALLILAILAVFYCLEQIYKQYDIALVIITIAGIVIGIYEISKAENFKKEIKTKVMQEFCKCFEDLSWNSKFQKHTVDELFKYSNLFYTDTTSHFLYDDVFSGSYDDTPFSIYELESYTVHTHVRNGKVRRERRTEFEGVVVRVKMNKNFHGNTVIRPDSLLHISPDWDLKRTELEDVEFEKKFDVYTTDEVEARYLITVNFMERIKNLQTSFLINKISCAFYKDCILIALHTNRNLFEPVSLFKSFVNYSPFSKMTKEILSIYKLIDYFKLNEKIGM